MCDRGVGIGGLRGVNEGGYRDRDGRFGVDVGVSCLDNHPTPRHRLVIQRADDDEREHGFNLVVEFADER